MTKPSMSHHFAILKDAGLVTTRREGQKIYYALSTTVLQDIATWLWDLFGPADKNRTDKSTIAKKTKEHQK
jgi:DNA-binding transcriptional ArsR family regulator